MVAMGRWPYTFGVIVAVAFGFTAVMGSILLDIPLKDPDGFLGPAYVRLPLIAVAFLASDILPRAIRYDAPGSYFHRCIAVVRDQWNWMRLGNIAAGLITFYLSYVSYRNLKSFLPLVREDVLMDTQLMKIDHWLFLGNYPAAVLHNVLGVDLTAHLLSTVYLSYLMLIPISLGAMLVWSRDLSLGCWYATALSLNWIFGTMSYYLVPSLGPAYVAPQMFYDLPESGVTALQHSLFKARVEVLDDPLGTEKIHGIAGFASLHVSVVFTACLFFHRIGAHRILRYVLWTYLVGTALATIYFGWHFVADVAAGLVIGWLAVAISAWASGNRGVQMLRTRRRERTRAVVEPDLL